MNKHLRGRYWDVKKTMANDSEVAATIILIQWFMEQDVYSGWFSSNEWFRTEHGYSTIKMWQKHENYGIWLTNSYKYTKENNCNK